jgi:hypothetical protein
MSNSEKVQDTIKLILGQVKEPYVNIWFRAYVFDNACTITSFMQPKSAPKTRRQLSLSEVRDRLTDVLLEKQRIDGQQAGNAWTCITITAKADGTQSVDLRYEDPETIDIYRLDSEWKKNAMSGLEFVPDKR